MEYCVILVSQQLEQNDNRIVAFSCSIFKQIENVKDQLLYFGSLQDHLQASSEYGETFASATMFLQQCFLVCHGLNKAQ